MDASGDNINRGKDLSDFTRGRIFSLRFDCEWTYGKIAKKLEISLSTVKMYCQRAQKGNITSDRKNCGRQLCTSERDVRTIMRSSNADRFLTAVDIQRLIPHVSIQTVRRRLSENGLKARKPAKKPSLSQENIQNRLNWAREHEAWNAEDWELVVFSDESHFSTSSCSANYVRRRDGERFNENCIVSQPNRSATNCSVRGAFSVHGATALNQVNGRLNSFNYTEILNNCLLSQLQTLYNGANGILQHDNAPPHASIHTTTWLHNNHVQTLNWPAYSPDMNVIENVWAHITNVLNRDYEVSANSDELFATIEAIWNEIMSDDHYRATLISSMPRRIASLQQANGGHTKY